MIQNGFGKYNPADMKQTAVLKCPEGRRSLSAPVRYFIWSILVPNTSPVFRLQTPQNK